MNTDKDLTAQMAEVIFSLRQKCALKDLYFVKTLGITAAEYNCLVQFFNADSLGVKELAEKLDITPGGVTRIITSLEEKKIVTRRISPEDRRGINVILTAKGKKMVKQIRQASMDLHAEILAQIDPQSRVAVVNAVKKLIEAIDSWLKAHDEVLEE